MAHIVAKGIDMWGGDEGEAHVFGFENAVHAAKNFVGDDSTKVATILHEGGDKYSVWFKYASQANSSHQGAKHDQCWTVFYGQPV